MNACCFNEREWITDCLLSSFSKINWTLYVFTILYDTYSEEIENNKENEKFSLLIPYPKGIGVSATKEDYEHDGINSYLEEITGSTSTIVSTQGIVTDLSFNQAIISATASMTNGLDYGYYYGKMLSFEDSNESQWTIVNNILEVSANESGSGDLLWSIQSGYFGGWGYKKSFADDGTTGFGGWMGSMCYCPLTDTVFIGVWGPSPDYVPMLVEMTPNMTLVSTRDLTELTASGIWGFDDIKWDDKKRVLALYNYWADVPGQTAIYDPVASTAVCNISPLEELGPDSIIGVSAGRAMGVNPVNGEMYFPQRFDGDVSAYTGSIKTYVIEPIAAP